MINETNFTLEIGTVRNLTTTGNITIPSIKLPFYNWWINLFGNYLKFWFIGLLILIFIVFGIIMYKFGKFSKNQIK
jgi:hypothetical protein